MAQDSLKKALDLLNKAKNQGQADKAALEKERRMLVQTIAKDLLTALKPSLDAMVNQTAVTTAEIKRALEQVRVEAPQIPPITIPEIQAPEVKVNIPPIKVPQINVPAPVVNIPKEVVTELSQINNSKPMPVRLFEGDGKPFQFANLVSGGKADFLTIKDIRTSSGASIIDQADGAMKVVGSLSATLSADYGSGEIGDNTLRTVQATDAISSVNVYSAFGSTAIDSAWNADNRLRVSVESGSTGLTDTELRAASVPVAQASGAIWSTEVKGALATGAALSYNPIVVAAIDNEGDIHALSTSGDGDLLVHQHTDQVALSDGVSNTQHIPVNQTDNGYMATPVFPYVYNGTTWDRLSSGPGTEDTALRVVHAVNAIASVNVVGAEASVAVTLQNPDGTTYDGDNPLPVGDATAQASLSIIDDWDAVHGSGVATDGPQIMAEARTSNPTAVDNADAVRPMADDLGRLVMRPITVRDLTKTAYATISSDAETTLLAGTAGAFRDLVYVMGANQSDGAATLDFYTGASGAAMFSLEIPANSTAGVAPALPIPMTEAAQAWYAYWADSDVTGTTVDISALFSEEV